MKTSLLLILTLFAIGCKKQEKPAPISCPTAIVPAGQTAFDSAIVTSKDDKLLTDLYRTKKFYPIWSDENDRKAAIAVLSGAASQGLDPNEYSIKKIRKFERKHSKLSKAELVAYDIMLTTSLQKYFSHLAYGKLDPKKLYRNWDLKPQQIDLNKLLISGITGDSLSKIAKKLEPQHVVYQRLKKALKLLDSFAADTIGRIVITKKIRRNDSLPVVIRIKRKLMYWHDLRRKDSITPVYDRETVNAMRRFQLRHGMNPDGVIGMSTVEALNFPKRSRRRQIIANLERWRWFSRNPGSEYVIVNIPAYRLHVVQNGDTVDTRRVVVGKEKRPTPVLSSTFTDVILNPTWTVPPTIIKEDLGPDAAKDSAYFTNRRLTIYDAKNRVVSPKSWNPAKPNNYRYVQRPGDDNSLGNVKFNFPNHFTVYLHDTNHRNFFGLNDRSLSSGCVRVQDPLPLAQYLIGDEKNWNLEKIEKVVAGKETTYIRLKRKINVHQWYWTAWLNKRGGLEFRNDIYNLDQDLYNRLRK